MAHGASGPGGMDPAVAAAFIEACPDAFVAADPSLRIIAWNRAAEELFGWSAEEVLGRAPPHLSADTLAGLQQEIAEDLDGVAFPSLEVRIGKGGEQVVVAVQGETEIRDERGRLVGWGRFLRRARSEEVLLFRRNELTTALAAATEPSDVVAALDAALPHFVEARGAFLVRRAQGAVLSAPGLGLYRGTALASVDPAGATMLSEGALRTTDGRSAPCVIVPLGSTSRAQGEDALLVLVGTAVASLDDVRLANARALVHESLATLRRLETIAILAEQDRAARPPGDGGT